MKKDMILGTIGAGIAGIASFWGGLGIQLQVLIIFMALDYVTGLVVAAVFKKSQKSEGGALSSRAGFRGLIKKSAILLAVLIAHELDIVLNSNFVKDAVILAYLFNESVSLIENIGLMGVEIPLPMRKAIDLLKAKGEKEKK